MKTVDEVTQQEFTAMEKHRKLKSYTNDDIAELYNLVRTYINPHIPTCDSCSGSLRDAKNMLNEYYNVNKEKIETRLNTPAIEVNPLDEAKKQVEDYKKESKRKKK